MNDLCLKFADESEAQQVLTAAGLATFVPEHTETVPACTIGSWVPIDQGGAVAAQLSAMFQDAEYGDRACIGDALYERLDDDDGQLVWCVEVRTEVPETTRTVPASIAGTAGARIDVIGPLSRPIGEPDAEGIQATEQLPGWHVNVLLFGDVPEALQPYIVTPTNRVRVWA